MVKVLIIANGAREHALAEAFARSESTELYCFATALNPGIKKLTTDYQVGDIFDFAAISDFIKTHQIDLVVPGPEAPICAGIVDHIQANTTAKCLAPAADPAKLENSKAFTRSLMEKYTIAGLPKYRNFTDEDSIESIRQFMEEDLMGEYVVKYDGLKGGKGVKLSGEHLEDLDSGVAYALKCLADADQVVVEEKFVGQEFSMMAISDGTTLYHLPVSQDHKRAYDGDQGPNTGGMGAYTLADGKLPFITQADVDAAKKIDQQTIKAIQQETGQPFVGILYGGYIATKNGIGLIEYNVRFGDPEAEVLLPRFTGDFTKLCLAAVNGELANFITEQTIDSQATVCLYAVPEGYPDNSIKGVNVQVPKDLDAHVYFASVDLVAETDTHYELTLLGSRAIAFVGQADTVEAARQKAVTAIQKVDGPVFYRTDIASADVLKAKVAQMQQLRS